MANRAIKYRAYPTPEQEIFFAKSFGCVRKIWNLMLADKLESYRQTGSFGKQNPASYKNDYPYLREVDSLALTSTWTHLNQAFKNHFSDPKTFGFPKFKSRKHSKRSYTTNNQKGTVAIVDGKYVKLPKIGLVKIKLHRKPKDGWILKSATVSLSPDGKYYISLQFAYDEVVAYVSKNTDNAIGLDYKSSGLYVGSDGSMPKPQKFYRKSQKRLARLQRQLSRKQKGSSNYQKQKRKVAKCHAHVANQRYDFLHKTSTAIAKQYDVVCIEDLSVNEVLKAHPYHRYHKAVYDTGWYLFTKMLEYKQESLGHYLVKVDKDYPSTQTCHVCGCVNPKLKDDSIRKWVCPHCGTSHHRDINAAINIKVEGLRILQAGA